jgi:antitoxin MazE
MRVSKWGNSLAIRLPAAVVKVLKLKEGDQIEVHITSHREFEISRHDSREMAINRLRQLRRPFPPGFIFDRKDAYKR